MFNPQDLLKNVTSTNSYSYGVHSKISSNYVKGLSAVDFKGKSVQNSTADYFGKAHSKMFLDNIAIFSKK